MSRVDLSSFSGVAGPSRARQRGGQIAPYLDATSVFFGHYWLPGHLPKQPMASHLACLDDSVAKDGYLVAYRWDGEQELNSERFLAVSR